MLLKKRAMLDYGSCPGCGSCPAQEHCPAGAFKREEDGYLFIDVNCTGCGKCVKSCPYRAVALN